MFNLMQKIISPIFLLFVFPGRPSLYLRTGPFHGAAGWPLSAVIIIIAFLALSMTSCSRHEDWVNYRGKGGTGYTANSLMPPLGIRWKLQLQEEEGARAFNPPVIRGDTIFFGSDDSNFYALDMQTGYMEWIFQTRGPVNSVPFVDDSTVYFGSNDGHVYAVDKKTGDEVWSFFTGNTVQSLVLRYEDYIIFTSDTGATFFLDLDGNLMHRIENPVWSHHTFQVYDGVVYWAPDPDRRGFGAFNIENRNYDWRIDVTAPYALWYSFPAISDGTVYFASNFFIGSHSAPTELNYYARDQKTGEVKWQYTDEMQMGGNTSIDTDTLFLRHVPLLDYMAPAVWKNTVIFTSGDTVVRAFDGRSGDIRWTREFEYTTSSAPVIAGDRIYFGLRGAERFADGSVADEPPKLICLSARNGSILWEMELEGAILSAPVISGKRMFFGTDANYFYVLEEVF